MSDLFKAVGLIAFNVEVMRMDSVLLKLHGRLTNSE